jgi:toxin YoeB
MSYQIAFTPEADRVLAKYRKSNPVAFKKMVRLMSELEEHPRTGTGHPEPLKVGISITYSRRITANDRLLYDVYDDEMIVLILALAGHYGDK